MQKLLRKSPSLGIIGSSSVLSVNFSVSVGLGFCKNPHFLFLSCPKVAPMGSASAGIHLHSAAFSNSGTPKTHFSTAAVPASVGKSFDSNLNSCRICKCSINNGAERPWVVLKEKATGGSRKAWFGTVAVASGEDGPVMEAVEKGADERPQVRIQRRHRGGSEMPGNPDLLSIPGVGPRNLRKLVQKGIGGVADLKQLYRDKVCFKCSVFSCCVVFMHLTFLEMMFFGDWRSG